MEPLGRFVNVLRQRALEVLEGKLTPKANPRFFAEDDILNLMHHLAIDDRTWLMEKLRDRRYPLENRWHLVEGMIIAPQE